MFEAGTATLLFALFCLKIYEVVFGRPGIDTYMAIFQTDTPEAVLYVQDFLLSRRAIALCAAYFLFHVVVRPGSSG